MLTAFVSMLTQFTCEAHSAHVTSADPGMILGFCALQDIRYHNDSVRKVALSPNDMKFVTASDDSTLKVQQLASLPSVHLHASTGV